MAEQILSFKEWLKEQETPPPPEMMGNGDGETTPPEMMDQNEPENGPSEPTPPGETEKTPQKPRRVFKSFKSFIHIPFPKGTFNDNDIRTGRTSSDGEVVHFHLYKINSEGSGKTTKTSDGPGHVHIIQNLKVLPAGAGNHTHKIQ